MNFCGPWEIDESCMDLPDDVPADVLARWQMVASELLWAASGRRYGPCEVTVRPCVRRCEGGPTGPYRDAAGWHNSFCGCRDDCGCTTLSEVTLEGPVAGIVQVTIDGDELMPEHYRLDLIGDSYRLVRLDGTWPTCQDLLADCEEVGSFCVTYEQGLVLSDLAIAAVSELTAELVKACTPKCQCKLPANVTSVVRRGVTVNFTPAALEWMRALRMVAGFLDAANPAGLSSASSVWSPDLPQRRTVLPQGS